MMVINLREKRNQLELTLNDIAKALDCHYAHIARLEKFPWTENAIPFMILKQLKDINQDLNIAIDNRYFARAFSETVAYKYLAFLKQKKIDLNDVIL